MPDMLGEAILCIVNGVGLGHQNVSACRWDATAWTVALTHIGLTANSAGCSLLLKGQFPPCPDATSPTPFHQMG
jgi:hypothetical protein